MEPISQGIGTNNRNNNKDDKVFGLRASAWGLAYLCDFREVVWEFFYSRDGDVQGLLAHIRHHV